MDQNPFNETTIINEETDMTTLIKTDTKLGEGAEAQAGQTVIVHYTGWLRGASYEAGTRAWRA